MLTKSSQRKLETCHPELQELVNEYVKRGNKVQVVFGFRSKEEQDDVFKRGLSKLEWPNSKHNKNPSWAIDLAPLEADNSINWKDIDAFNKLGEDIKALAKELKIDIVWGGDWPSFKDRPHFELKTQKG